MTGYVAMSRNWQDHDMFEGDEFSRRDAWAWLIAQAAWKPTTARIKGTKVELARGEMSFSVRFLGQKWGWSKSKVDRFIANLRAEGMIETRSKIGTTAGHNAGQGQSILTICNYDKYQAPLKGERDNSGAPNGTTPGQQRDKEEPRNQETIEPKNTITPPDGGRRYAFEGSVIRLTPHDLGQWEKAYPLIDIPARLQSRDDWLANEADEKTRKRWFVATSNYLANLQQEAAKDAREAETVSGWDGLP